MVSSSPALSFRLSWVMDSKWVGRMVEEHAGDTSSLLGNSQEVNVPSWRQATVVGDSGVRARGGVMTLSLLFFTRDSSLSSSPHE